MILSQTTSCAAIFGDEKAIEIIAKAGFDAVDFSMSAHLKNDNSILNSSEYKAYTLKLLETAKRNNVYFNQGHALGSFSHPNRETAMRILTERNIRALEIAGIMGIKHLVVHPVTFGHYIGREEEVFENNMKYYKNLLPYAEEYGVKIACENMWCDDKKRGIRTGSVCSNPYEHAHYIDEINNPFFVACLDVGHCSIAGREASDCIRVLGDRVQALHIHDNDYLDDMHTLPGLSEMNWEEITKALADIDYKGDFTLEADHFFDSFETTEEMEAAMRLAALTGRKMINKIELHRTKLKD